jgi:putative hydrolase
MPEMDDGSNDGLDGTGDPDETPDDGPDGLNPFAGMPLFGDLSRALSGQGPLNWDAARQFALLAASGGDMAGMMTGGGTQSASANIDPSVRIKYAELAAIARMHVADVMQLAVAEIDPEVATPEQWAAQTLDAYRPLFNDLATSLGQVDTAADDASSDPMGQMMAGLSKMMAPAMMGMSVGSMVGGLARRAFGVYDLPIPRATPALVVVPPTIDAFATEWEISLDEMRLWVISHELAGHTLFSIPHVADHLRSLVQRHVGAFKPDASAVTDKLVGMDMDQSDPMAAMQAAFGDPEVLLGAVRSAEQLAMEPQLDAAVAVTIGVIDWVVDAVAVRVIGGNALQIAEAVRRRRADASPDDLFVERLLGIRLGADQTARGKAFVQGVVDRAGENGLGPLFNDVDSMPTPSEIEAPGLWLARVADADLG